MASTLATLAAAPRALAHSASTNSSVQTPSVAHVSKSRSTVLQRLQQAAIGTAAAALVLTGGAPAALAKGSLLDLPSCSKFVAAAGIEYCDVRQGSGASPEAGDQVEVDYTARAEATGKVYDGSLGFQWTLGQNEAIPGWELAVVGGEGLPAIKEGGVRTVRIPPELAYGEDGTGCLYGLSTSCRVPPNSPVVITFKYNGLGY